MSWTQPLTERQRLILLYMFEKFLRDIEQLRRVAERRGVQEPPRW